MKGRNLKSFKRNGKIVGKLTINNEGSLLY